MRHCQRWSPTATFDGLNRSTANSLAVSAEGIWRPTPLAHQTNRSSQQPVVEDTTRTKEFAMTAALDPGRPFPGRERELLENTLELNRTELVRAVEHLSDTQAREKLVPSLTTPMSLIKHC